MTQVSALKHIQVYNHIPSLDNKKKKETAAAAVVAVASLVLLYYTVKPPSSNPDNPSLSKPLKLTEVDRALVRGPNVLDPIDPKVKKDGIDASIAAFNTYGNIESLVEKIRNGEDIVRDPEMQTVDSLSLDSELKKALSKNQLRTLLSLFPSLEHITLPSYSQLDKNALEVLVEFPAITSLSIHNFGPVAEVGVNSPFSPAPTNKLDLSHISNLSHLRCLVLRHVELDKSIPPLIQKLANLRSLAIGPGSNTDLKTLLSIVDEIKKLTHLKVLLLEGLFRDAVFFTEEECQTLNERLTNTLETLKSLEALDLSSCPFISKTMIKAINLNLKLLSLNFCHLKSDVEEAINSFKMLTHLYLYGVNCFVPPKASSILSSPTVSQVFVMTTPVRTPPPMSPGLSGVAKKLSFDDSDMRTACESPMIHAGETLLRVRNINRWLPETVQILDLRDTDYNGCLDSRAFKKLEVPSTD